MDELLPWELMIYFAAALVALASRRERPKDGGKKYFDLVVEKIVYGLVMALIILTGVGTLLGLICWVTLTPLRWLGVI